MIRVVPRVKLVAFKGVYRIADIEAEILRKTKRKRVNLREWTIVGISSEEGSMIVAGMPYSPIDGSDAIGFKLPGKSTL